MTLSAWLETTLADAEARRLPALKPLLENLARSSTALRAADWNADASHDEPSAPVPDGR